MDDLRQYHLDERAGNHAIKLLSTGGQVSKGLSEAVRKRSKSVWTLIPMFANDRQAYQFESGGICNIDPAKELSDLVYQDLISNKDHSWILIDNVGINYSSLEQASISGLTTAFTYDNEFLQLLNKQFVSIEAIYETFRFGGAYPFVGFVSTIHPDILGSIRRKTITSDDIVRITRQASLLLLGAYDEETYLVLELNSGRSS